MNCKYCGAALPSTGGHCPECGKMIPISQMKTIRQMTDPRLNEYHNKDTAFYKKETAYEDTRNGKIFVTILAIIFIIIIILLITK